MSKLPKKQVLQSVWGTQPATHRKGVPHRFVLDAIAAMDPTTRATFGASAVYVGEKIVFLLRDRSDDPGANGVWLAIPTEYQKSLHVDFPNAKSVRVMGRDISGWRLLSVDAHDFEESALHACELIIKSDPRIGKVPNSRRTPASKQR